MLDYDTYTISTAFDAGTGEKSADLTIFPVTFSDQGTFQCQISGCVTLPNPATVEVWRKYTTSDL